MEASTFNVNLKWVQKRVALVYDTFLAENKDHICHFLRKARGLCLSQSNMQNIGWLPFNAL